MLLLLIWRAQVSFPSFLSDVWCSFSGSAAAAAHRFSAHSAKNWISGKSLKKRKNKKRRLQQREEEEQKAKERPKWSARRSSSSSSSLTINIIETGWQEIGGFRQAGRQALTAAVVLGSFRLTRKKLKKKANKQYSVQLPDSCCLPTKAGWNSVSEWNRSEIENWKRDAKNTVPEKRVREMWTTAR